MIAPDTGKARLDSLKREADVRDSIAKFRLGDTVRAPFARSEEPRTLDIGRPLAWNREQLMTSGALSLADLLDRVPGATGFRASWMMDQEAASFLGDFARVRVFIDGLPYAPPDRDGRGVLDLNAVQLWAFERLVIERGAAELRLYLRTARHNLTVPVSRVDVFTGDQDVNIFRGFFAQRFGPGFGVEASGENLSLSNTRTGGDGSRRAGVVRLGWAGGRWSVDLVHNFTDHSRRSQVRSLPYPTWPAFNPSSSQGYARVAWGDPDVGTWMQAIAATSAFASPSAELSSTAFDTNRVFDRRNAIYSLMGGTEWSGLRISAGMRWHSVQGTSFASPLARVSYDRGWIALQTYGERSHEDSTTHGDVSLRLLPRPWLALGASYGGSGTQATGGKRARGYASRAEVGLRVRAELWLSGGILARDSAFLRAPYRFDSTLASVMVPAAQGSFVQLKGRVYNDIFIDLTGTAWDQVGAYRPHYQTRAELFLQTRWLSRFPSGAFGLLASLSHDYREPTAFPFDSGQLIRTSFGRSVNARLEVRILSGTVSWQLLNLAGDRHDQLPGALRPRSVSVYGVRWDFRN